MITELNERSRTIFRFIVDTYLATGTPVGSGTIARTAGVPLSPASIRNVMADLEENGLLYAPHTSAGRMPTEQGIRLYIDGLMQVGNLSADERRQIEGACARGNKPMNDVLEQATTLLSGLSSCASLVIAPKINSAVKQIQFVQLAPRKILTVLVFENGLVENRIMDMEQDVAFTSLAAATNYLNARVAGKTLIEAEINISREMRENRTQLDAITQDLVGRGLALPGSDEGHIIIRGQSRLLEDVKAVADLGRARALLAYLEKQKNMLELLGSVQAAEGVQIFIGTENKIFDQSGWSMIIAPYKNPSGKIIGAIGVIGPTRLDYDRIIPMVDYTSRVVSNLMDEL
ncbi:MAG: heat-inducible transcriptional repressor HrcA [Alphaproteobacteria bacterium]